MYLSEQRHEKTRELAQDGRHEVGVKSWFGYITNTPDQVPSVGGIDFFVPKNLLA